MYTNWFDINIYTIFIEVNVFFGSGLYLLTITNYKLTLKQFAGAILVYIRKTDYDIYKSFMNAIIKYIQFTQNPAYYLFV